jgi:hypothetical protein
MLSKRKPQKASKHGSNYRFNFRVCCCVCRRYLLLPPRQKEKERKITCIRCKTIPTSCNSCTWWDFGFYGIVSVSLQLLRMVFRSFLSPHLGRTFLPLRSKVLTAVGAMLPPTPPSNIFPCRAACILRMFLYLCRQVNAVCRL